MTSGTRRFWTAIGAAALVCVAAGLVVRWERRSAPRVGARKLILDLDLEASYPETPSTASLERLLSSPRPTIAQLIETLDRAGNDDRVAGLVARVGSGQMGMARAQELRDAISRFRARRKFAVAFAETFGEGGNGSLGYYLATAFDEIWMQPSGDLWLTGIELSTPFVRGSLDKLAVQPVFGQRYEYKNAVDFYTQRQFTAAHREAMEKLKDSWFAQIVRAIGQSRHLSADAVAAAVDRAPLLGPEAVEARLVDGLAYRDEVLARLRERSGRSEIVSFGHYRASLPEPSGRHAFALVYGVGEVTRGRSDSNPLLDSQTMGAESVVAALRAAAADPQVKAIIFRVDSPGGSYVASDTIWREVGNARRHGKPVVVSMGDLAGSGGYFVAINADKIVAEPGTITGSIGVFGGKFVLAGLFEKIGLSFDEVHSGEHALFWDSNRDFTPSERARFDAWLDRVYDDFTKKVAQGRRLPQARVLEIARGRIWSGEDARSLGLVDELGGLETAVRLARVEAKIPTSDTVRLLSFPRPRTLFEVLRSRFSEDSEEIAASDARVEMARRAAAALATIAGKVKALGLTGDTGILSMPPVRVN